MEISRAFSIHADYRDKRAPPSWEMFLFADVVLIDKTNANTAPFVYQLNDTAHFPNDQIRFTASSSWKDNCTLLGEMIELDKRKKLINLASKNVVSYKHLIVINGKKPLMSTINHEITNALHALAEAIKVNPTVDSLLLPSSSLKYSKKESTSTIENIHPETSNSVMKATHPYFADSGTRKTPFELDAINERLYEIYL